MILEFGRSGQIGADDEGTNGIPEGDRGKGSDNSGKSVKEIRVGRGPR